MSLNSGSSTPLGPRTPLSPSKSHNYTNIRFSTILTTPETHHDSKFTTFKTPIVFHHEAEPNGSKRRKLDANPLIGSAGRAGSRYAVENLSDWTSPGSPDIPVHQTPPASTSRTQTVKPKPLKRKRASIASPEQRLKLVLDFAKDQGREDARNFGKGRNNKSYDSCLSTATCSAHQNIFVVKNASQNFDTGVMWVIWEKISRIFT
ncbi:hypothetical protein FB446DRAFT_712359 [Lentinula raphanica]|nr:hypothetical protein FB446DRAFT_712359 [Lentinula raphanica]